MDNSARVCAHRGGEGDAGASYRRTKGVIR